MRRVGLDFLKIFFLPPYSPFLTPIEEFFGYSKFCGYKSTFFILQALALKIGLSLKKKSQKNTKKNNEFYHFSKLISTMF